jgi:hypothetical protein
MIHDESLVIDISKLENVRPNPDGSWQAACPKCREEGSDKTGNHLRVYSNMAFNCVKYGSDKNHNRDILSLNGGVTLTSSHREIKEPKIEVETTCSDSILSRLVRDHDYWNSRGISSSTLDQFEGGLVLIEKMKNRYVFILRNENNKIHGITGRYVKPIPENYKIVRWKHLGNKKNWIFDRKNSINDIKQSKTAILVEGVGCVLALREVGIRGVLPMFGVFPSSQLLCFLVRLNPDRIIVSLNNEPDNVKAIKNGNRASEELMGILGNIFSFKKLQLYLPTKKDWLDSPLEDRITLRKSLNVGS